MLKHAGTAWARCSTPGFYLAGIGLQKDIDTLDKLKDKHLYYWESLYCCNLKLV